MGRRRLDVAQLIAARDKQRDATEREFFRVK